MQNPAALRSFFSVRYDLIATGIQLPFDLFVNSSSLKEKEKFVRIFPAGDSLGTADLENLKYKYIQLYIAEDQRHLYMKSLIHSEHYDDTQKANVLKDSALEYLGKIFDENREFSTELLEKNIEGCREVVENMVDLLGEYDIDSLRGLIGSLSFHDFYTYDHSINVSMYCISIWHVAHPNAPRQDLVNIGLGGLLHDLGKVKIPTNILNSPGGLSESEYEIIKKHPTLGLELLLSGEVKVHHTIDVNVIARIVHEHHENWNGTGYPAKIRDEEIHPMARACTIADFFDAITTKRSYNQVMPIADALNVMRKFRGIKLEPSLFDIFEKHVDHVKTDIRKDLVLADRFDPTIPWETLPLEEIKAIQKNGFGKIKLIDNKKK
ncbi:MAG: HD domain-containing protein [Bacteriovoracaceae bacterium]|nr:HD domain-containing protein [Bacteriovoracaceae bacterium]